MPGAHTAHDQRIIDTAQGLAKFSAILFVIGLLPVMMMAYGNVLMTGRQTALWLVAMWVASALIFGLGHRSLERLRGDE